MYRKKFNGKLLLTGEYVLLDGALAIALPTTKFGQYFEVKEQTLLAKGIFSLKSVNCEDKQWFEADFDGYNGFKAANYAIENEKIAHTFSKILVAVRLLNPDFIKSLFANAKNGFAAKLTTDFPLDWGLGSSSTLIAAIADWANIDAFELNQFIFGGSGYDIACAVNDKPFLYSLNGKTAKISSPVLAENAFAQYCYFIYLGKKQNSREGIAHYKAINAEKRAEITPKISKISQEIVENAAVITYNEFNFLLNAHEDILAEAIELEKAKDLYFFDFWGSIKSLGAWGGDFVLATSDKDDNTTRNYFKNKGFDVVLHWQEIF